jgi:hypothetical protein
MTFIDGSTYEGSWKSGRFHGTGTLTFGETSMLNLARSENGSLSNLVTGESIGEQHEASANDLQYAGSKKFNNS